MGMAARKPGGDEHESVTSRLKQVLRDALKPKLKLGAQSQLLEELVEEMVDALRAGLILGLKRPRALKSNRLALARRLPEVGVTFPYEHKGKVYKVSIVEGNMVDVECEGQLDSYRSLKQVQAAILGYDSPVTAWRFFFGPMSHEEVTKRYKVDP